MFNVHIKYILNFGSWMTTFHLVAHVQIMGLHFWVYKIKSQIYFALKCGKKHSMFTPVKQ